MLIIPVIDLSHGLVVHAKKGERNKYQPLESVLTTQTSLEAILESYFKLYPFKNIYIADLDAIQGTGNHLQLLGDIAIRHTTCEFWVDAGIDFLKQKRLFTDKRNIKPVLGSENKVTEMEFTNLIKANPEIILSLDFSKTGFVENTYLLKSSKLWPENVIVMMLHRVGTGKGIDQECLTRIQQLSTHSNIFVAGGISNRSDLIQLKDKGIAGALLATSLHNGMITREDLESFS